MQLSLIGWDSLLLRLVRSVFSIFPGVDEGVKTQGHTVY